MANHTCEHYINNSKRQLKNKINQIESYTVKDIYKALNYLQNYDTNSIPNTVNKLVKANKQVFSDKLLLVLFCFVLHFKRKPPGQASCKSQQLPRE